MRLGLRCWRATTVLAWDLGRMSYARALNVQKTLVAAVKESEER